jgi:peptidoglycan/xylan/chitin deacetylase (PgdA/CDA1 family)
MLSAAATATLATALPLAAAALFADAALRPGSQLFGRTLIAGHDPNELALTYDDGPNDHATSALLDLLAQHNVRATFFMIGRFVQQRPELARRVLAAGHLVGNHTLTHPWLSWQSPARIRTELTDCNRILEDTLGAPIRYFRPPHGARRPAVFDTCRELGLTVVQWNSMGQDWNPISPEAIVTNVRRGLHRATASKRGGNILLHDGWDVELGADRTATVAATAQLMAQAHAQGKRFVTVDAWNK